MHGRSDMKHYPLISTPSGAPFQAINGAVVLRYQAGGYQGATRGSTPGATVQYPMALRAGRICS